MYEKLLTMGALPALIMGLVTVSCAGPASMDETDRALLVTMEDPRDFGIPSRNPAPGETYDATRYSDGMVVFEYEYDSEKDPSNPEIVFVKSDVEIARNAEQAKTAFEDVLLGFRIGLAIDGVDVSVVEDTRLVQFGDQSYSAYMLSSDGVRRGNLIVVRQENVVLSLILGGYYFDNPRALYNLIQPRLKQAVNGPSTAGVVSGQQSLGPTPAGSLTRLDLRKSQVRMPGLGSVTARPGSREQTPFSWIEPGP